MLRRRAQCLLMKNYTQLFHYGMSYVFLERKKNFVLIRKKGRDVLYTFFGGGGGKWKNRKIELP